MPNTSYTPFNAMLDILAAPGRALDEIRNHGRWFWWPLLLTLILSCLAFVWYYTWVDFPWLVEQTINGVPAEGRAEAAAGIRTFMTPTTSIATTLAAILVITFLIYTIQAAYLHLANKLTTGAEIGFGGWFSFSAWTAFPNILGALAIFVVILLADSNQLGQDQISPLSMNSLFLHAKAGEPWFNWGNSLNLLNIWVLFLMAYAYARWTKASLLKSTIITWLPWVAIFGGWAAMI